ncbi:2-iminobutanoate/2-iminopropanoate deaminase [Chryseobacterium sp. SORGH_AS 1048]|nr:2-iminobutanoate/2-iminopropanoate deaminase [Chryseobacterium sp. SORGH_AS_1048]
MEKQVINPWTWQEERNYVQAVEVRNVESTLYVSGQTAISDDGISSDRDMRSQLLHTIRNLEKVIREAGYELNHIVRLNIYTTSASELFENFGIVQEWLTDNGIRPGFYRAGGKKPF